MQFLFPEWPAPPGVRSLVTTRTGGCSEGPYRGLNLALHVGDAPETVARNRQSLRRRLELPSEPVWMEQVHGTRCLAFPGNHSLEEADAAWTDSGDVVLAVMVADCLPVFVSSRDGHEVAVVHAGWRGLAAGVIESTIGRFQSRDLVAWMGPAIGPCHYEVDGKVRDAFPEKFAFSAGRDQAHWMLDLYAIAASRLTEGGVQEIFGGGHCTYCNPERFYSYRRDGETGRMAALIWRE